MRDRRGWSLALACVLALGACAGGGDDATDLADVFETETTDAEAPDDGEPADDDAGDEDEGDAAAAAAEVERFTVPDEIDPDYLQAVFDRMHEGLTPLLRDAVAAGEVTPELEAALHEVFSEEEAPMHREGFERKLAVTADDEYLAPMVPDLVARTHPAVAPRIVGDGCVLGTVTVEDSGWFGTQPAPYPLDFLLVEAEPAPPVNPTPWRIAWEGQGLPEEELDCR